MCLIPALLPIRANYLSIPILSGFARKMSRPRRNEHVKTQQNKWKALFGGIPTSKTFVDSKLAPYINVAKTFEDHPNPAQVKQIRAFIKHQAIALAVRNPLEVVELLYLSSVRTMTIFDSSWRSSNPTLDVFSHLVLPLKLSAASCVRAT